MKKRIVACILAFTILFTDIAPVAAGGNGWQNSSFQKTIDWLFGHSDELGYAEISAAAAEMKHDYSLLQNSLEEETSAKLIHILNSYAGARAGKSADDSQVGASHRKLWEYFKGSVKPYDGSVLKVQPMLQVRNVKETENEVLLSVYEWVYMTYEINGRKDISAHGFDHQMVFRNGDEGWTLVQDLWNAGEGENFEAKVPGQPGDVFADEGANPTENQTDVKPSDADGEGNGLTGTDEAQKKEESTDKNDELNNDSDSEDGKISEGGSAGEGDVSPDSSEVSDGDEAQNGDTTEEDKSSDKDSPSDIEQTPGTDNSENEDTVSGEEGNEVANPDESNNPDAVFGEEDSTGHDIPADEAKSDDKENPINNSDNIVAGNSAADNDTYPENPTENTNGQETLFPEIGGWEEREPITLFASIQESINTFFAPLATMFSVQTYNYTYSYKDAVAYADKYATSYNPAYENYNSIGGDCANFVSQCLYAGGLPMTDNWFFKKDASGKSSRSGSWSLADGLFKYVSQYCGTAVVNADASKMASEVTAGNPVFYYSSSKGRYSHAAICVGVNASGVPVIDAHNNDHLRAVWTLGSGWAKRAVVKINGNGSNSSTEAPALPPEELGEGELWQITASSLNLREGAGTTYAVVGVIPESKVVCVTEKADVNGKTWGKTTYNGTTGWCSLAYASYVSGSIEGTQATGITMNKTAATISGIGNTLKLTATVTPAGAASGLVWTSDNFQIATVDETGLVKAVGDGTVVITAQTTDGSDKTASCIVSVADKPVTSISLSQTSLSFNKPGVTAQLSVSYVPSNPSTLGVTWKSSNPDVVSVDANGKVSALKNGAATITATAKDGFSASASCKVNVGKYTVKYNLNGGKNSSKNKSSYYSMDGMKLYNPTRSGYAFAGWYTKKAMTSGKITKIAAGKTKNYTLYAKWVKLARPTLKKLQRKGSGKVKVFISKTIAGATGYEIQCATNTKFTKGVKTKKTTVINKSVSGLQKGKRYYVRVRPYIKIASGNYVYGSYSGYRYITVS